MTRRAALAGVLLGLLFSTGCGGNGSPAIQATPGAEDATAIATKTVEAGAVTVRITPLRIDKKGARFEISMDTHSVDLDMDIAKGASLEVDGKEWTGAEWQGDGPSGHHREGELSFDAGGSASGTARLELDGFPEPVEASWDLP